MTPLDQVLRKAYLPGLQGSRALFVLAVIFYHGGIARLPGDLGVAGFFVLSGFLITWLLLKERFATGTTSLRDFYMRRVLRIFPAYFVFIACAYGFDIIQDTPWTTGELISALTYTVNYDNALTGTHPVPHTWSLAIEEQFYLLWPFLFTLLFPRRVLATGLGVLIGAVMLWRSFLYGGLFIGADYVYHALDTRFDALAVGCLTAVLCTNERFTSTTATHLARRAWFPLVTLSAVVLSRKIDLFWHYTVGMTVESVLLAVFLLQILQLAGSGIWARVLENRVTVWLGALSYSMYLWHGWGLQLPIRLVGRDNVPVVIAVGLVVTTFLAAGSYYVIELPFLRLKRRFESAGRHRARMPGVDAPATGATPETAR